MERMGVGAGGDGLSTAISMFCLFSVELTVLALFVNVVKSLRIRRRHSFTGWIPSFR